MNCSELAGAETGAAAQNDSALLFDYIPSTSNERWPLLCAFGGRLHRVH
jgi:hypothetical protein